MTAQEHRQKADYYRAIANRSNLPLSVCFEAAQKASDHDWLAEQAEMAEQDARAAA